MAQFFTNFSENPISGGTPSGWTNHIKVAGGASSQVYQSGNQHLFRLSTATGGSYVFGYDDLNNAQDVETLTLFRIVDIGQGGRFGINYNRYQGNSEASTVGYNVNFTQASNVLSVFVTQDSVGVINFKNYSWSLNTWYYMRFRTIGNIISAKIWPKGSNEPAAWLLEQDHNGPSISNPYSGVGHFVQNSNIDYAFFSAATGGETAIDHVKTEISQTGAFAVNQLQQAEVVAGAGGGYGGVGGYGRAYGENLVPTGTITTRTQQGKFRVKKKLDETSIGQFRVQDTFDYTQSGKFRIQHITSREQSGVFRVKKTLNRTQTGLFRVGKTLTVDTAGKFRIQKTLDLAQTGQFRVASEPSRAISGTFRVQKDYSLTQAGSFLLAEALETAQLGRFRVSKSADYSQTGSFLVEKFTRRDQDGMFRIYKVFSQEQAGKFRVSTKNDESQSGVFRISKTLDITQDGKFRVYKVHTVNQLGKFRVAKSVEYTQNGAFVLQKNPPHPQYGAFYVYNPDVSSGLYKPGSRKSGELAQAVLDAKMSIIPGIIEEGLIEAPTQPEEGILIPEADSQGVLQNIEVSQAAVIIPSIGDSGMLEANEIFIRLMFEGDIFWIAENDRESIVEEYDSSITDNIKPFKKVDIDNGILQ